ncbi:hypothetical protein BJX66DRAFT_294251 [Aspergillus keveii]|uniref:Uncharacterized protein n=1 Tax=Aspergillus keveii TaxID=714993 RepID=A0ABR4GJM7_9EURO
MTSRKIASAWLQSVLATVVVQLSAWALTVLEREALSRSDQGLWTCFFPRTPLEGKE